MKSTKLAELFIISRSGVTLMLFMRVRLLLFDYVILLHSISVCRLAVSCLFFFVSLAGNPISLKFVSGTISIYPWS